jgi:hypothetical protein
MPEQKPCPPKNILSRNIGIDWTRALNDMTSVGQANLEKIFMEEWNKENMDVAWINNGFGVAQLLMIISAEKAMLYDGPNQDGDQYHLFNSFMNGPEVCIYDLTEREQRIIATIVQWLGTNVGFGFICRCFRRAGYEIRDIREPSFKPVKSLELKGRFRILRET